MIPKGLIFDCDGTLADTMPLHWRAWSLITQRHGLHFPEDRFYSPGGVPSRDILKLLADEQGRSLDRIAVAHEKDEAYLLLMTQAEPIHAVVEIAKEHHGKIPMAVASGGSQKIICDVLEHLGIRHLFGAVERKSPHVSGSRNALKLQWTGTIRDAQDGVCLQGHSWRIQCHCSG